MYVKSIISATVLVALAAGCASPPMSSPYSNRSYVNNTRTAPVSNQVQLAQEMADSTGIWAVNSEICNLWTVDYFSAKVMTVQVRKSIPGLHDRFRKSVTKAATDLMDPSKRFPCGYVQQYGLQSLVNWERLAGL